MVRVTQEVFFEVLDINGVTQSRRGWTDTASVPMAKGTSAGTMRFAMRPRACGCSTVTSSSMRSVG